MILHICLFYETIFNLFTKLVKIFLSIYKDYKEVKPVPALSRNRSFIIIFTYVQVQRNQASQYWSPEPYVSVSEDG